MVFYAHYLQDVSKAPLSLFLITNRNDLDDQLKYNSPAARSSSPANAAARQMPQDIERTACERSRANGIIFTTMQKFESKSNEALGNAETFIVMADEAHHER